MAFKDWRKNYLCLIGAIIGLISIFLPWETDWSSGGGPIWNALYGGTYSHSLFDIITWFTTRDGVMVFGEWIFVISSILVFISPMASISQMLGLSMIGYYMFTYPPMQFFTVTIYVAISSGFFIALIGVIISIVSLIKPIGKGYSKGLLFLGDRMLTLNPLKKLYASYNPRINQIALFGTFVGIISLFVSWFNAISGSNGLNAIDVMSTRSMDDTLVTAAMLFLIGTILSIITPAALFVQLTGLIIFVADSAGFSIGLGVILGFVSAIILLVSIFRSSFLHPMSSKRHISRLLTFGLKIEIKCPACGNILKHIRGACPKCAQSSESSIPHGP